MTTSSSLAKTEADLRAEAEERELVRQGERTVDNLKRLYAFVFAISFGAAGLSVIDRLKPLLIDQASLHKSSTAWLIDFEMVLVFGLTASVFYHQGAKFLDNRYARSPLAKPHLLGFAWDYLSLGATMVPFFFMAQALSPTITNAVGYIWYFWFYISLLAGGLILLALNDLRHSKAIGRLFPENLPEEEIQREVSLRLYWLPMNGFVLLLMMIGFKSATLLGISCPTSTVDPSSFWLIVAFGVLALLRDVLDYRYAWTFTFPNSSKSAVAIKPNRNRLIGYPIVAAALGLIYLAQPWDVSYWASACSSLKWTTR